VTVSVGIACHDGASSCASTSHENCRASDLVLAADSALYDAKRSGRDNSRRYSTTLAKPVAERLVPDSKLRGAQQTMKG